MNEAECIRLVGNLEGPRRRWVDNIATNFREIGCGATDCIGLAHDREKWLALVKAVMNLRVL
jgi:hypothetical protein